MNMEMFCKMIDKMHIVSTCLFTLHACKKILLLYKETGYEGTD